MGFVEDLRAKQECHVVGEELDEMRDSIDTVLAGFADMLKLPHVPNETAPRVQVRARRGVRRVSVGVGVDMPEQRVVVEFASQPHEEGEELFWSDI